MAVKETEPEPQVWEPGLKLPATELTFILDRPTLPLSYCEDKFSHRCHSHGQVVQKYTGKQTVLAEWRDYTA